MDTNVAAACIELCLRHMQQDLEGAAAIAKAANACAEAGNPQKAIEIALDVEQLIDEAETLLNATSLLNRITKP
jgi:leucyl aminopeptidase